MQWDAINPFSLFNNKWTKYIGRTKPDHFHGFVFVEKSHNAPLSLIFLEYIELWNYSTQKKKKKSATTKRPTFKIHSTIVEFRNARDPKLPFAFSYLLIKTAVITFSLFAMTLCYNYMISSLQLSQTVR